MYNCDAEVHVFLINVKITMQCVIKWEHAYTLSDLLTRVKCLNDVQDFNTEANAYSAYIRFEIDKICIIKCFYVPATSLALKCHTHYMVFTSNNCHIQLVHVH